MRQRPGRRPAGRGKVEKVSLADDDGAPGRDDAVANDGAARASAPGAIDAARANDGGGLFDRSDDGSKRDERGETGENRFVHWRFPL